MRSSQTTSPAKTLTLPVSGDPRSGMADEAKFLSREATEEIASREPSEGNSAPNAVRQEKGLKKSSDEVYKRNNLWPVLARPSVADSNPPGDPQAERLLLRNGFYKRIVVIEVICLHSAKKFHIAMNGNISGLLSTGVTPVGK